VKIKNWDKFQHFKDRRPPWIKLHREILDQLDINLISDCSFRVLVGLWLLASEDETKTGTIPEIDVICFRLRKDKKVITQSLHELSVFLHHDDIDVISDQYQLGPPETETETETETELLAQKFAQFWKSYPKKKSKLDAEKAWTKLKPDEQLTQKIISAVELAKTQDDWTKDSGKYIPYPASWLRAGGFLDGDFGSNVVDYFDGGV